MADWVDPPWAELVAGKPWTDEKAAAAFENAIAIAEGAIGAPRVEGRALKTFLGGQTIASGGGGYTGLERHGDIMFMGGVYVSTGSSAVAQARYSNDGGSTWGSWQNLLPSALTLDIGVLVFGNLNLQSGDYNVTRIVNGGGQVGVMPFFSSGTHTVPSDCESFQVRFTNYSSPWLFYAMGGLA